MRKLVFLMASVVFVLAAYSTSMAAGSDSIDMNGLARVSITAPTTHAIPVPQTGKLYLDSKGLWAANDVSHKTAGFYPSAAKTGEKLNCFDSAYKFCAKAP